MVDIRDTSSIINGPTSLPIGSMVLNPASGIQTVFFLINRISLMVENNLSIR